MLIVKSEVTQDDINHGKTHNARFCPIACAIGRKYEKVRVTKNEIALRYKEDRIQFVNSSEVEDWVNDFDATIKVEPITIGLVFTNKIAFISKEV